LKTLNLKKTRYIGILFHLLY